MTPQIKAQLTKPIQGVFHKKLLEHCKGLVDMSRRDMQEYYDKWEAAQSVYKGERAVDCDDKKAIKQGAPTKIVLPLTYAQIQTFVAFAMGLLQQRDRFFELEGTGEEDHRAAKLGEALLDQNLDANNFSGLLYQFLLNLGRFSMGVIKHGWVKETETVWVEEEVAARPQALFGRLMGIMFQQQQAEPTKVQVSKEQIAYHGNRLYSISPFNFFPDTRLPLTRYQEGEFCASEEELSRTALRKGERNGLYAGVSHIKDIKPGEIDRRKRWSSRSDVSVRNSDNIKPLVWVTSVQLEITPSQFLLDDGTAMGDSVYPEKWIVEYANDDRIIRAEPMGYVHNHFTYHLGLFSFDDQEMIAECVSEMIAHLQSVIDWFINSHVTNVRRHISNRLVVDPAGIHFEDVRDHSPVIRLKPGSANAGVDRFIKQLTMSDVTRNHIQDVQTLLQFVSMTTAISDNLMGQFHTGRRSAREAGNVANATGQRLRNIIKIVYDTCLRPMGRDLLSNCRDGLDSETFVTVSGDLFPDWDAYKAFKLDNGSMKVGIDRTKLAGRYDFKVFEGVLPSDKYAQAETLEQTLLALMRNPQGLPILTQMLGYDPGKLFKEVLQLRGIKHPDRFKLDQFRQQELLAAQQQQQQIENATTIQPGQSGNSGNQPSGTVQNAPGTFESLLAGSAGAS